MPWSSLFFDLWLQILLHLPFCYLFWLSLHSPTEFAVNQTLRSKMKWLNLWLFCEGGTHILSYFTKKCVLPYSYICRCQSIQVFVHFWLRKAFKVTAIRITVRITYTFLTDFNTCFWMCFCLRHVYVSLCTDVYQCMHIHIHNEVCTYVHVSILLVLKNMYVRICVYNTFFHEENKTSCE